VSSLCTTLYAAEYVPVINEGGRCLDLAAPDLGKDGGFIQHYDCNGSQSQQWTHDAQQRLVNVSGKCLDVSGADLHKAGGKVQVWACNDAPNQKWTIDAQGRIMNGGGFCLYVIGPDLFKSGGGNVHIWDCNDAPNQHWWYANRQTHVANTQTVAPVLKKAITNLETSVNKELASARKPAQSLTPPTTAVEAIPEPPQPFTGIVAEHNKWREAVNVPALRWSNEIAAYAKEWATTVQKQYGKQDFCGLTHRPNGRYGQNLFAGYRMTPQGGVNMWAAERHDYTYTTNSCANGKACGHYTQIVWRNSTEFGCAEAQCGNGTKLWICDYNPYGNIVGQKPY
jgi:uncharacterized protein YkwD